MDLQLDAQSLAEVKKILGDLAPTLKVWAFGSRATGTAKRFSDLDLALEGEEPVAYGTIARLKHAFSESDLPIKVDVVDWNALDPEFKAAIAGQRVPVCAGASARHARERAMQQQISVITLGIADLARSRRFYVEGFGWKPVFGNAEVVFYQMNGLMLGTWLASALEEDSRRTPAAGPGAFALAHNVVTREDVQPLIDRLARFGGRELRPADAPPHGGFRGYIADPDGHAWEIAWNPAWPISPEGHVTFGL